MLLLKGFFRKKTTKIYLLIFSVLLFAINIMSSFANYCDRLSSENFEKNSYIVVASKNDYYNILSNHKKVLGMERALFLKPDYNYKVLSTTEDANSDEQVKLYWEDFVVGGGGSANQHIFAFPSNDLIDNEIALGLDASIINHLDNNVVDNLLNQKIGFYIGNESFEFIIADIYESSSPEMRISNNLFADLLQKNLIYAYKISARDEKSAISIVNELKKTIKKDNAVVSLNQKQNGFKDGSNLDSEKLKTILDVLIFVSYVTIIAFLIMFVVAIKNIIEDERKNQVIQKLLGYNKKQLKVRLFFNLVVLTVCSLLIASLSSLFILITINEYFSFNLNIFDYQLLLKIFIYSFVTIMLLCTFFKANSNNVNAT